MNHLPPPHILGIRHHGPGSARALVNALTDLQPDCLLIEGPPDGDELIHWIGHKEMVPPIALLVYRPDQPNRGTFYPFAEFSPEYQALRYGVAQGIETRFMDLPQRFLLATPERPKMPGQPVFELMARAAGYQQYESWWHQLVEQRQNSSALFDGLLLLMDEMRQAETAVSFPAAEQEPGDREVRKANGRYSQTLADQREAYMRTLIRQAYAAGHRRIAVVCGAWHGPALVQLDNAAADAALLTGLESKPTETAWVPWTYGRLASSGGYGAGIHSPGWYDHLWRCSGEQLTISDVTTRWLTHIAHLLRQQDLDASPAHIIEASRLADALAAMRDLPFPGLPELNEATQTVMCEGDPTPMKLIQQALVVGERMGQVPPDTPMAPLQRDLYMQQQKLGLLPDPSPSHLTFDLRKPLDLQRSHLLHRLTLLKIPWGKRTAAHQRDVGTYQESWRLTWKPTLTIQVVEANIWGNTVRQATIAFVTDQAEKATDLSTLTGLLDLTLLADLPDVVLMLMEKIQEQAALSSDVPHMMEAVLPLARILTYGSARQIDRSLIEQVVHGLITRICIGLPSTCSSLDDNAAAEMVEKITAVHGSVNQLRDQAHQTMWQDTLAEVVDQPRLHGLVAGKLCRLLLDSRVFTIDDAAQRMTRALSSRLTQYVHSEELTQMAFWIDGFMQGSGLLLIHDQTLWQLLDQFVVGLKPDQFQMIMPLLRRTFSSFSEATRQQINQRIRHGQSPAPVEAETAVGFNETRAQAILPSLRELLGIEETENE